MRKRIVQWIVRKAAHQYDKAYNCYVEERECGYWPNEYAGLEAVYGQNAKDIQKYLFPIARLLDKDFAMADEMIKHGWWG